MREEREREREREIERGRKINMKRERGSAKESKKIEREGWRTKEKERRVIKGKRHFLKTDKEEENKESQK